MSPSPPSVRPQRLPKPAVLLAAAIFATAACGVATAGSCSSCSGADRDDISFRASADLEAGGSVSITLGDTTADVRTKSASTNSAALVTTATGDFPTHHEALLAGTVTVCQSTGDGCSTPGLISADFVPTGGCGVTYQIRTRGPSETPSSDPWEGWSNNLHPLWMYIGAPADTLVVQYQIRILRTDGGIPTAPQAINEMTPPAVDTGSNGLQTAPAAFSSRIPMGATTGTGGFNAGSLALAGPLGTTLASRGNMVLRSPIDTAPFDAGSPDLLHAIDDTANVLRQVRSANRLMDLGDVIENSSVVGFRVRVFEAGSYSNTLADGLYPINQGAEPSVTHTYLTVPAATGHLGGLRVETLRRDGTTEVQTYLNTTTSEYIVTSGDGLETVTVSSVVEQVSNVWHRTDLETVHRDGVLYARTSRSYVFQTVDHSANTGLTVIPFMTSESRHVTANDALTTNYTASSYPGLPELITRPDGSWERRIYYDGSGTDGGQASWARKWASRSNRAFSRPAYAAANLGCSAR